MPNIRKLFNVERPNLTVTALPKDEWDACFKIEKHLSSLNYYARRFASALELFDSSAAFVAKADAECDAAMAAIRGTRDCTTADKVSRIQGDRRAATDTPLDWQRIAAADGAMTIFHFGITFRSISEGLKSCQRLSELVGEISEEKMLSPHVPDFWSVRHAVAHQAENSAKFKKHLMTGPFEGFGLSIADGATVFVGGMLYNRTYAVTVKNEMRSYDLSWETLAKLCSVRDEVYAAFARAEDVLAVERMKQLGIDPEWGRDWLKKHRA